MHFRKHDLLWARRNNMVSTLQQRGQRMWLFPSLLFEKSTKAAAIYLRHWSWCAQPTGLFQSCRGSRQGLWGNKAPHFCEPHFSAAENHKVTMSLECIIVSSSKKTHTNKPYTLLYRKDKASPLCSREKLTQRKLNL